MLLTVAIIQALLSAAALAHPTSRDRLHDRIQRRQSTSHISNPAHSFEPLALINNVANVQYTGNWAGAALVDNNVRSSAGSYPVLSTMLNAPTLRELIHLLRETLLFLRPRHPLVPPRLGTTLPPPGLESTV